MMRKLFYGKISLCTSGLSYLHSNSAFEQEIGSLCSSSFDSQFFPYIDFGGWVPLGKEVMLFCTTQVQVNFHSYNLCPVQNKLLLLILWLENTFMLAVVEGWEAWFGMCQGHVLSGGLAVCCALPDVTVEWKL